MTSLDDREVCSQRAVLHADFWVETLPAAAELVIRSGLASPQMLIRKLILPADLVQDALVELHELGVVGPAPVDDGTRAVLVGEDKLTEVLATIAGLAGDDTADQEPVLLPPVSEPLMSLVKASPTPPSDGDDAGDPGGELAVRPDDDVALHRAGGLERAPARRRQTVVGRTIRTVAWHSATVVDHPVVMRGRAVTRQAPRAGARLVIWTPRGALRLRALAGNWLFATRAQAHVQELADARSPDWEKASRELRSLHERLATRRWLVGVAAGGGALVELAWWAPDVFAILLGLAVFGLVLAAGRGVCREPKELATVAAVSLALGALAWWKGPDLAGLIPRPPGWAWWVGVVVVVAVLGWIGRQEGQKLVEMPPAMVAHKVPIVTAPMVIEALCSLGNSKMKEADSVRVLMDPHRAGPGVQIDLELPRGVTASFVMENREKFAGALRRELGTVWPSVGRRHPGHLALFVSDQVMAEAEQEPWPLLVAGQVDIFQALPAFTDQLGKWAPVTMAYASMVIGASPRMGKTYVLRQFLLMAGLDRRTKVIALDGKGTGDLSPIALFAHAYVRGARVNKPENIEKVRDVVRWLLNELGRRADIIDSLPDDECPDSKVTSELIDAHPELDLGPIVVGVDETQSFFSYGAKNKKEHKEIREEIRDGFVELMKLGPALGIWVYLATQIVRESTIPTEAAAVAVIRFALKLEGGWEPNDRILGTGSFSKGIDANMFDFADKGIGILKAEGQRSVIVRSVFGLDAPAARKIAVRCRQMRIADGRLTGDAGNQEDVVDAEVVIDVVQDVEQVMRQHERGRAQHVELVEWLRELRPENYGDLDVEELSARLRGAGVPIRQVRIDNVNRKGVRLSDLGEQADDEDE